MDIESKLAADAVLSPEAIALRNRMLHAGALPKADEIGVDELAAYGLVMPDQLLDRKSVV